MAKFIVEVEEGVTQCEHCPFADSEVCDCAFEDLFVCSKYDLSDLKITKYEDYEKHNNSRH